MELTIAIIVKNPPKAKEFLEGNKPYLEKYPVVVVDSGGGEDYAAFAKLYEQKKLNLTDARKYIVTKIETPFIFILDADVLIPKGYPEQALELLRNNKADAVSIFYEDLVHCQGALEFGCSIWRTSVLLELYDFSFNVNDTKKIVQVGPHNWASLANGWCECTYMWRKIKDKNLILETLPFRAIHLKGFRAW